MKTTKNYYIKKTEKLLGELDVSRNALAYLTSIQNDVNLPPHKAELRKKRIRYLTNTLDAVGHALELLDPTERTVIERMCIRRTPGALDEVCEICGLEKSSVYRHRSRALKKLAAALYGEGEVV